MIDTRYKVRNLDTENLKTDTFRRVNDLKYLRNFVTENIEIRSETKTRVTAGNMWCS